MKKQFIRFASSLFPSAFARIAYEQLTHPQVHKLREHELSTLDKARQEDFDYLNFKIKTYAWNENGSKEAILLIHGWEGQAGNFSDLVEELIKADYRIFSFDGPSHGFSSKGSTSLFEFVDLVGVLIEKFEVKNLISHSFGGVATSFVLSKNQQLKIDKYLLFTTPDKFSQRIDFVAESVGVSPKVKQKLIERLEAELKMEVSTLNVSEWVKTVNVKRALILHDKNDKVLPIEQSLNVHRNWEASQFETVEGTGHFRILRTKSVLDRAVAFFNDNE
ncbi:MAG: alpha/beta hydrolase [Crocinitomicaceae bacterium]|nr:alpha/beta hydrolase [Flavobacteriales bacterium]NQZ38171.1 alpha/beta hydrolase [Crocinitomicaceae bacterium]